MQDLHIKGGNRIRFDHQELYLDQQISQYPFLATTSVHLGSLLRSKNSDLPLHIYVYYHLN